MIYDAMTLRRKHASLSVLEGDILASFFFKKAMIKTSVICAHSHGALRKLIFISEVFCGGENSRPKHMFVVTAHEESWFLYQKSSII